MEKAQRSEQLLSVIKELRKAMVIQLQVIIPQVTSILQSLLSEKDAKIIRKMVIETGGAVEQLSQCIIIFLLDSLCDEVARIGIALVVDLHTAEIGRDFVLHRAFRKEADGFVGDMLMNRRIDMPLRSRLGCIRLHEQDERIPGQHHPH